MELLSARTSLEPGQQRAAADGPLPLPIEGAWPDLFASRLLPVAPKSLAQMPARCLGLCAAQSSMAGLSHVFVCRCCRNKKAACSSVDRKELRLTSRCRPDAYRASRPVVAGSCKPASRCGLAPRSSDSPCRSSFAQCQSRTPLILPVGSPSGSPVLNLDG